jgi:serine protease Do
MSIVAANTFAPLAAEAALVVEALRRSVVLVQDGRGHGSGLIWESDGLIVTNDHVVAHDRAHVELTSGQRYTAAVVARDPHNDLALLRVPASGLPAPPFGDSAALCVGELIIAVGNPFGVRGTASLGIVSAAGSQTWMGPCPASGNPPERQGQRELLQADVSLAPGSSGGPLADASGAVVGIASMVLSPGIAVAVPMHVVRRFVARVIGHRPAADEMV